MIEFNVPTRRIGLVADVQFDKSVNPMVVAVAQAAEYVTLSGARVGTDTFALTCRQLRSAGAHRALTRAAGTSDDSARSWRGHVVRGCLYNPRSRKGVSHSPLLVDVRCHT
ncbi:hypothetical protein H5V45_09450 [Nocardioides sp. KIGAM211]|uniref:Uncharacterized protein n=1 Tax=Nocardioides luti TaxID=2761101 RepID=A0A7X0RFV7_9ACTN|nr:hypothetical protein [Nocardioides luti]